MSMANVLTGDVGGTSTRLGIFELRTPRPALVATRTYGTRDFASIETMTVAFLRDVGVTPSSLSAACFGVAGPVIGDAATLTNAPVRLDARAIATSVGLARVALLNDLEALAYAVPVLSAEELLVLQDGRADPSGPIALIAAGTGLGEAMLHRIGERVVAKASEGGRADFAARTERDIKVLRALTRECGRAAVEHVVSGPGLVNIHKALHPEGCAARIDMTAATAPGAIADSATARTCAACVDTMELFVEAYGAQAGNLALRAVATGGVYIGGGIAPKIRGWLQTGSFLAAFRAKTPFAPLLESIPVKVILNSEAGLLGAAHYCLLT